MSEPWYVSAFRQEYLQVYPHRSLEAARREVSHLWKSGLRGRVLDLCCGFGRHTLALLDLGVDAYGIDLSMDLLAHARVLDERGVLRDRLVCADARRVPLADGSADGVANLFSSFGYFGDRDDGIVIDEIARVLRPNGLLVMDLMNPVRVRRTLVPTSEQERGGMRLRELRSLSSDGKRVMKDVRVASSDGSTREWRETVRLYERGEIEALLRERGLEVVGVEGEFDGSTLTSESPRQVFFARKTSAR